MSQREGRLSELIMPPGSTPDPGTEGFLSGYARSTPAEPGDPILVELKLQPGVTRQLAIGWAPWPDGRLPTAGDLLTVAILDDKSWWILGWWPHG